MELQSLFKGTLVRLAAPEAEDAEFFAHWSNDDLYLRMLDSEPARPLSVPQRAQRESAFVNANNAFNFRIRTLEDNELVGECGLYDIHPAHRSCQCVMSIGDRAKWGKGYGTDAMRLLINFGFNEINLHRIALNVISYNERAIRMYESLGFTREGTQREAIERDGRRFDVVGFGLIRSEWKKEPMKDEG